MSLPYPAIRSALSAPITDDYGPYSNAVKVIQDLFPTGTKGFWFPLTDFASLRQDFEGTIPYTELEQPVAYILNRAGSAINAKQNTSTARGSVTAKVNIFDQTEFQNGLADLNTNLGVSASTLVGYLGAIRFTRPASDGAVAYKSAASVIGITCVFSATVKMDDNSEPRGLTTDSSSDLMLRINNGSVPVANTQALGAGLYRITSAPTLITNASIGIIKLSTHSSTPFVVSAYSLVPASQAGLRYQSVETPTIYDSFGFPRQMKLDGVEDFYLSSSVTLSTGFYFSDVVRPMGGLGYKKGLFSDGAFPNIGYKFYINEVGNLEFAAGNGTFFTTCTGTTTLTMGVAYHVAALDDGVNLKIYLNGVLEASVPRPVVSASAVSSILYKFNAVTSGTFNGYVTEPIHRGGPPPTEYERSVIRNYQMQKAGIL